MALGWPEKWPATRSSGGSGRACAGAALQAAAGHAEGTRREPVLSRIHPRKWEELGWPELVGNELAAAPEFGLRRVRRCGARGGELMAATCS